MSKKNKVEKNKQVSQIAQDEETVLAFWNKAEIFKKSVEKPAQNGDYVFYDGPPFATGLPHYGHIVASVIKDTVPRFWTMKGYRVERKWGWDCHGLPIENIVEKEMGTKSKKDIEKIGVDKFNELCRSKVLAYVDDWKKIIAKLGRWADMENDYKTMDLDFMESVWHVFKTMYERDLIYKGYRSMHICPRCETTLSQSEVAEGYRDIKDLSVIAKFELIDEPGTFVLAWTTTPWTLIGNVALAVGEGIKYQVLSIKGDDNKFIVAKDRVAEVLNNKDFKVIKEIEGKELVGLKYKSLFNYYSEDKSLENRENGWKIYAGDFVSTEEGTGVVHIAPAFGDDDMALGKEYNLPFVQHLTMDGNFKTEVKDFPGLNVKPIDDHMSTDIEIIKYLAHNNLLFHKEKYEHSYPHCWRCDTPLINYATSSWFVNVLKIKKQILKNAEDINWSPNHIKNGRWGKWLEGARDWSISRQRFWASVMPIWECEGTCDNRVVVGSVAELEKLSGTKVADLHKHIVDEITFKCDKCGKTMKRIPDVLDTWFDSGSMPFAQMHYPFENKEKFENNFPAEFIAEGTDQTRCWFYYMHVLASGSRNTKAFNNVIVNGIVLAEDGKKMSKRLQNYPDPILVFDRYGADALRYYLLTSPIMLADNLNFSEKGVNEALRKVIMMLNNVQRFYKLFADNNIKNEAKSKHILDKWIIYRLKQLIKTVGAEMKNYNLPKASRPIVGFIDDLSTWYIRRSRDRFKGDDKKDKKNALSTLGFVLLELSKVMAPFTPFVAEKVWQSVSGYDFKDKDKSVHLGKWPKAGEVDKKVIEEMAASRKIVELALAERDKAGIKVRQPLADISVVSPKTVAIKNAYIALIKDEVNVKAVKFNGTSDDVSVKLNTVLTKELEQEGLKRELVRTINAFRKKMGLSLLDRVNIIYDTSEGLKTVINKFEKEILKETLSIKFIEKDEPENKKVKINNFEITLKLEKI
ncbi:MAG: isoleucine--tRNA ligase [Patescibacteria group bacterium]|nr:isoleucine--tRNA ligase [Patescibacteria group bacterium]